MKIAKLSLGVVLVGVACNGQLSVTGLPGAGGSGGGAGLDVVGTAGRNVGTAGHDELGDAGHGDIGETGGRDFGTAGRDFGGGSGPTPGTGGSGPSGVGGWRPGATGGTGDEGGSLSYGGEAPVYVTGGSGPGPSPGGLGLPCVPGGLVTEADGTPAKTQVMKLPRCAPGLSCDADNKCTPTPDCPQSGKACVVRHAPSGGSGLGGAPGYDLGFGGWSSAVGGSGPRPGNGGNGSLVYDASDLTGVTAITATESRVYWVEYGTRDALGNYQHDGALLAYSPDDGTTTVLASGLEGPTAVEVTTSYAYVYVDGARPSGTPIHPQLLRVPVTGGTAVVVQEGALPASFAATGSQAFWSSEYTQANQNIYTMTSDSSAVVTEFVPGINFRLAADTTDLYYQGPNGLMRTPLASAAPVALGVSAGPIVLHDDSIFSIESVNGGGLLSRAPKSGGEFLRVRALGAGYPALVRRAGERFFVETSGPNSPDWRQVVTATLGTEPPIRLLEPQRGWAGNRLWAATANSVYWSEGRAVYRQPIPTP